MTVGMLKVADGSVKLSRDDLNDNSPDVVVMAYELSSMVVGINLFNKTGQSVSSLRQGERFSITFDLVTQVSSI